ncbi:hypothetical protein Dsin_024762 [Dipteronia sinensis]|uniref:Reverse transcriptase domain-containing protein n=1 Tax=Dipteronia sinensis TaxID=43782 RepID=A0AAD9ZV21_9ROSI|nr:hypothetical protein Dsin_024762 [Dipteronia sinensis]
MSDQGFFEELFLVESRIHHDLDVLLHRHECFLHDRSRINGVLLNDRLVIRDHNVGYYSAIFSSDSSSVGYDFSMVDDVIPNIVTVVENDFLIDIPSVEDIHDAIFAMDVTSTPGLNGFSGLCSSFIVLLQKLRDSISIDQYHPIVLSNFLFKISSKILADRLAQIAARIVSPYQFGSIRDRHIEYCIALALDCVNVLHKKCYGANLAMKIDIRKAFDTLD